MIKTLVLLALIPLSQLVTAQQVKFGEGQYPNGLVYPIAQLGSNPAAQTMLNKNIMLIVSEYEAQDYCIGQYGYVQQTNFIQMNFYFNCIDMDESKKESHLFSLDDGEPCPTSEMFLDKKKKAFRDYFIKKVNAHYVENGKTAPSDEQMKSISIDNCTAKLLEEGIEISRPNDENWPGTSMTILWSDVQSYLKTTFI